jgi:hypothetical protein
VEEEEKGGKTEQEASHQSAVVRDPRGVVAVVETGCPVSRHRVTDPIMFQIGTRDRAKPPSAQFFSPRPTLIQHHRTSWPTP